MNQPKRMVLAAVTGLAVAGLFGTGAFATGGGHTPVTICHNGHTITVDDDAVQAHLDNHGDTLGECVTPPTEEPTNPPTEEPTQPPTEEPTVPPTDPPVEPSEPPVETTPPVTPEEPTKDPVVPDKPVKPVGPKGAGPAGVSGDALPVTGPSDTALIATTGGALTAAGALALWLTRRRKLNLS